MTADRALKEKVATAIYDAAQDWIATHPGEPAGRMPPTVLAEAAIDLIRAEVLEEAAEAVAYLRWQEVDPFDGRTLGYSVNTIRALKEKA